MCSLSFLQGKSVSFSCVADKERLLPTLSFFSISVKTWGRIHALIVGDGYESHHKYTQAQILNIPILRLSDIHLIEPSRIESALWVDLYKPTKLEDIIGNPEATRLLDGWLSTWSPGKSALLTGPPGIGKTSLAHLVATKNGYEIVEFNASNERSASAIRKCFEEATRSSCIGAKRLFIMDEVDGMSSGDRGGVSELAKIIRTATFPILCIANERTNKKLQPLLSCSVDIRCAQPHRAVIAKQLFARIVKPRGLSFKVEELERLCEANGNDIRQIVNFLHFSSLSPKRGPAGNKDELQRVDIFTATGRIFARTGTLDDRLNCGFVDSGLVPLMVAEGYIGASMRNGLSTCCGAAELIGNWDILDRVVYRGQNWSLMPAALVSAVGAASVANGPAPFHIFPSWLGKNSKRLKHRRAVQAMRIRGNLGSEEFETRELLRLRLFGAKTGIVDSLISYGLTRDDMLETLVDTVFTGDENLVKMDTKMKSAITREWRKRGLDEKEKRESPVLEDDDDELDELCEGIEDLTL